MKGKILIAFRLFAGIFLAIWASAAVAEARFLSSFVWRVSDPQFGGFSGMELSDDGASFTTITDRGWIVMGQIQRDGDKITGITAGPLTPLRDEDGKPLGRYRTDSEGLAVLGGGAFAVSFEGQHRVMRYDGPDATPEALPVDPDFAQFQRNSGLEALAVDPQGRLLAVPERSGAIDAAFPVYRLENGAWQHAFTLARSDLFQATGMDVGPDGRIYLLERDFTGLGFRSRVRVFEADGSGGDVLFETLTGTYDNLEGLSVWQDAQGHIRLTMISDDNFRYFQRTQFVEYILDN